MLTDLLIVGIRRDHLSPMRLTRRVRWTGEDRARIAVPSN
jgi:hypothetical protein